MNRKTILEISFITLFCLFFAVVTWSTLVKEKDILSVYENRNLATMPVASVASIADGTYFDLWESFFSDHAFGRKTLIKADISLDMNVIHRPVINDVVVLEDKLLPYQSFQDPDVNMIEKDSAVVSDAIVEVKDVVESYGGTFLLVIVPAGYDYFSEDYPFYLSNKAEYTDKVCSLFFSDLDARGIPYLDIGSCWEREGRPISYMSGVDHHFTWDGAYSVYKETLTKLNQMSDADIRIYDKSEIKITELPNPYMGSYLRKLWGLWPNDEKISYGEIKETIPFIRRDNGKIVKSQLFLNPSDDIGNVEYNLFMGGDIGEVSINTNRSHLPDLLIYGDSFSNAEETLLYASFDEMRSLDFRHYDQMSLKEYVEQYHPDFVIGFRDYESMVSPVGNGLVSTE